MKQDAIALRIANTGTGNLVRAGARGAAGMARGSTLPSDLDIEAFDAGDITGARLPEPQIMVWIDPARFRGKSRARAFEAAGCRSITAIESQRQSDDSKRRKVSTYPSSASLPDR